MYNCYLLIQQYTMPAAVQSWQVLLAMASQAAVVQAVNQLQALVLPLDAKQQQAVPALQVLAQAAVLLAIQAVPRSAVQILVQPRQR
jgi:hypothetical protein